MPTIYDAVGEFQERLLRNERRAAAQMVRVYADSWKRIKARLAVLQKEYERAQAQGQDVGLAWLYQKQRLTATQALVAKELAHFSAFSQRTISSQQARAIAESLAFNRDMTILAMGAEYDEQSRFVVNNLNKGETEALIGATQRGSALDKLFRAICEAGAQSAEDALVQGMVMGYNPRKIAPMIRDALGIQLNRALTISRTEVMRAQRIATAESYKANADVIKGWRWQAALTGNTCPVCLSLHGSEHPITETMSSHPNCLPSGTMVSGPVPTAGTARYYSGELVTIRAASGIELAFTPNHPVLTRGGWVAGGLLKEGDYVVRSTGRKNAQSAVDINYNDVPTPIEKVVKSFDMVFVEMPTAPEDFHGDGKGSQVHVVFTDSFLGDNRDAALDKPPFKKQFSFRAIPLSAFSTLRSAAKLLPGVLHSLYGRMSRGRIGFSFFGCHLTGLKQVGGGITANSNARSNKSSSDHRTGNSIGFSEGVFGFPSDIAIYNDIRWQRIVNNVEGGAFLSNNGMALFDRAKFDSALNEDRLNAVSGDMKISSEFFDTLPFEIELDKVVEINRSIFSGHVYNLQTKDGWYIANSIITHNCRCTSVAITKSWEELGAEYGVDFSGVEKAGPSFADVAKKYGITPEQQRTYANRKLSGEAYFRSLSAEEQRAILGPSRWLAWKDGKFGFDALSRKTYSALWGEGVRQASLVELLGEAEAKRYMAMAKLADSLQK